MNSAPKVYCGHAGLRLRNIAGLKPASDISSFFENYNYFYVHKGRTAIRLACQILDLGPNKEILAPSYNCGSEIDALISSGTAVTLYRIDRTASIDIQDLESKITNQTKAVYVTHYFGFPQPIEHIKSICVKNNLYLIEDCALTLFSCHKNTMMGTAGDIAIFSLPKTLPVPDGGILLINNAAFQKKRFSLTQPKYSDIFIYTLPLLKAALVRWLSLHSPLNRLHRLYGTKTQSNDKEGDISNYNERADMPRSYYYNDGYDKKDMSFVTQRLIKTFEISEIRELRRRNFAILGNMFKRCDGVEPLYKELPVNVCPLNFPLLVEKRDTLVKKLNHKNIDAGAWWRGYHKTLPWSEFPDACYLKNNLMTLPVHQDILEEALRYMATRVKDLTCKRPFSS